MTHLTFAATPGRTAVAAGVEYLFFSGYAYLGMHQVPEFCALIKEGIDRYGSLFPSSRISNTRLDIFEAAEAALAAITNSESAVLFSSGFAAGQVAVGLWPGRVQNLFPYHPAIAADAKQQPPETGHRVYAIDAINPMTAAITDFSFLQGEQYPVTLIVDDSHGFGILGLRGEGIISVLPSLPETSYVLSFSLSKAMGIAGGAICCSAAQAEALRHMPAYTAATAPSPALLYACINSTHLYAAQREKLRRNVSYLQQLLQDIPGISHLPELPIFILPVHIPAAALLHRRIIISSFAYPGPGDPVINRIVVNALHTEEDLERLAAAIHELAKP